MKYESPKTEIINVEVEHSVMIPTSDPLNP